MSALKIDFAKGDGLVPVIVQDHGTREVLMVAYMNKQAWDKTVKTGKAHYYSRSRRGLWFKGEESGHFQVVKNIFIDCDNDTLLLQVQADRRGGLPRRLQELLFSQGSQEGLEGDRRGSFRPQGGLQKVSELKLGLPKGSLEQATIDLFKKSGWKITGSSRSYFPTSMMRRCVAVWCGPRRCRATSSPAPSTPASPAKTGRWRTLPTWLSSPRWSIRK